MFRVLGILILIGCFIGLISPLITPLFITSVPVLAWLLDLASHWQWLYGCVLVMTAFLMALTQKRWLLSLVALILPFITASPALITAQSTAKPLKIMSTNVYYETQDLTLLRNLVAQEKPDIIVLLEFANPHAIAVSTWADYPYHILQPSTDPFGMAILSKFPLNQIKTLTDQAGIQHIVTQVQYTKPFKLIGFHPIPPMDQRLYRVRDTMLKQLTESAQEPTLIAGDFNATPWSSAFNGLKAKGFYRTMSLLPTWPVDFKKLMGIPIDQVVASSEWKLINSRVGATIGSDHYPVIVELSL